MNTQTLTLCQTHGKPRGIGYNPKRHQAVANGFYFEATRDGYTVFNPQGARVAEVATFTEAMRIALS